MQSTPNFADDETEAREAECLLSLTQRTAAGQELEPLVDFVHHPGQVLYPAKHLGKCWGLCR